MFRHAGLLSQDLLHGEAEALAVFVAARQLGDHADHFDVAPLPFVRQADGQALTGLPSGVIETEARGETGYQHARATRNAKLRLGMNSSSGMPGSNHAQAGSGSVACCCSSHTPKAKQIVKRTMRTD